MLEHEHEKPTTTDWDIQSVVHACGILGYGGGCVGDAVGC